MSQKGLIFIPILIGILSIAAVAGFIYLEQKLVAKLPFNERKEASFSASLDTSQSFGNLSNPNQSYPPTPLVTSNKSTTNKSTPTPSPTIAPSTKAPTPTPSPTPKKNTCEVNVIYGKLSGAASDALLVTLMYSFSGYNAYMSGAQWDFDGNGTWDTDLKQLNGDIEHTYPKSGTYTPRLQLQGSDGVMTDVCSKSLTVPSGITIKLTGTIYSDINCNGYFEPNEKGVVGAMVRIFKMPEYSIYSEFNADGSGYYSFSQNVQDSISLSPSNGVVPDGYKSSPKFVAHTFAMGSGQPSINVDIPIVPYENVGACSS